MFSGHKDERHEYLLCNNLPTLLWLAQSGTLEFHVWHSRAKWEPDARSKSTDYASSLAVARSLGAQLSRLRAVRHRSLHLFRQGSRRRGAGAQYGRLRKGQGSGVLAARAPAEHVARGHREDVGQDRPPRVRADPAHARLRCGAPRLRARGTPPDAGASEGHHARLERAQADRQDLHGLQHERPRQDAQRRVFAARRAGRTRFDASDLGRACQRPPARLHDHERRATVGERRATAGPTPSTASRASRRRWHIPRVESAREARRATRARIP